MNPTPWIIEDSNRSAISIWDADDALVCLVVQYGGNPNFAEDVKAMVAAINNRSVTND